MAQPRHRSRPAAHAVGLCLTASLFTTACSGPAFVDSRREAGSEETVGASTKHRPVVCYSVRKTSPEQVLAMAAAVCESAGEVPLYRASDWLDCTLMQPRRAIFECVEPGTAGAGVMPDVGASGASAGARPGIGLDGGGWEGGIYPDGHGPGTPTF